MMHTREQFLTDSKDREAYKKLFADIKDLAISVGDPDPTDERALATPLAGLPLRLRIAFGDRKGASLKLQHINLEGQAALLWFFPSDNVDQPAAVNRVSAMLSQLPKVGIRSEDVTAYRLALEGAEFVTGGGQSLKTSARVFKRDEIRAKLIGAIRTLIERIGTYAEVPARS
jgi:hypothetical protein